MNSTILRNGREFSFYYANPFPLEFEGIKKVLPNSAGELGSTAFVSATPYFH